MPTQIGRLLLGMRAQLTAAMRLAPDCKISDVVASDATLDLRSAGCFVTSGTNPTSASSECSEQLRTGIDQTLPSYEVLEAGEIPDLSNVSNKRPSAGTILKAVRFAPGSHVSCDQVRKAKF
jgi:hypothetical protein